VETARSGGILANPREAEDEFRERDVLALAEILNVRLIDGVNRRPETGDDLLASLVQLSDDKDFRQLGWLTGGVGGRRVLRRRRGVR
jgi:hypothetical protein